MKSKLLLCLALVLSGGLFGCSTTDESYDVDIKNDGFQLEPTVSLLEKSAATSVSYDNTTEEQRGDAGMAADNAIDELNRHYFLWGTNATIPPRLSKAVLTVYPFLTNAPPDPESRDRMWSYAVGMLAKSHDPAMVVWLRPYLKDKSFGGAESGSGLGSSSKRTCDVAAEAICSLIGRESEVPDTQFMIIYGFNVETNGVTTSTPQTWDYKQGVFHPWQGYDPAYPKWDKMIAKLEKQLDTLGYSNKPPTYTAAPPVIITNKVLPNGPLQVDPATGLPIAAKP